MISYYIFYHDIELLNMVKPAPNTKDHASVEYVNLNKLQLPDFMKFECLSPLANRAIYSESLGLLLIKPRSRLVGCFTYSIPLKFSEEWAKKTGNTNLFLPKITFGKLFSKKFEPDKLYGVEFKEPDFDIVKNIHKTHLGINGKTISKGPFKGSFVVSSEVFSKFQKWFAEVTRYLIEKYKTWEIGPLRNGNSKFTATNQYKENDLEMDKCYRHGISAVLERLTAYYFGQLFSEKDKVKIGPYINS